MRQATLQLKTSIKNVNVLNNIDAQKIILNIIISIFIALALWYVLILGNMVANIVQRRTLEKEALTLSNQVSDLELSYLTISNSVNLPLSLSAGFTQTKATFATRKSFGYNNLKQGGNEI